MRTSSRVARVAVGGVLVALAGGLGLGVGTWPGAGIGIAPETALAFDGTSSPTTAALAPGDSVRGAARVPEGGERAKTLTALQYAADQGHLAAQWKVGRMYADGKGVPQNDTEAQSWFEKAAKQGNAQAKSRLKR